jgi:hypothetical protein
VGPLKSGINPQIHKSKKHRAAGPYTGPFFHSSWCLGRFRFGRECGHQYLQHWSRGRPLKLPRHRCYAATQWLPLSTRRKGDLQLLQKAPPAPLSAPSIGTPYGIGLRRHCGGPPCQRAEDTELDVHVRDSHLANRFKLARALTSSMKEGTCVTAGVCAEGLWGLHGMQPDGPSQRSSRQCT